MTTLRASLQCHLLKHACLTFCVRCAKYADYRLAFTAFTCSLILSLFFTSRYAPTRKLSLPEHGVVSLPVNSA